MTTDESAPQTNLRDPVDVLADEFVAQFRQGRRPSISEYIRRNPNQGEAIAELFPAIAMIEQLSLQEDTDRDAAQQSLSFRANPVQRVGDYRIVREIGRGGMGVVYEAEQESLGRRVAVKVLAARAVSSSRQVKRFRRESRAAARLQHSNIVPVFEVGECDGLHYYVMPFIDGRGLDAVVDQLRSRKSGEHSTDGLCDEHADACLPSRPPAADYYRAVARLGAQAARALQCAHAHQVLHRDIKPSNLLLDREGTLWIADFGLAKLSDAIGLTRTGDVLGTVRYMAPEQLEGRASAASDVYSLGLTLYELSTLRQAFDADDRLTQRLTQQRPPAPRSIEPRIPRDFEAILLKASAPEIEQRYASAEALADDLERFAEGRTIAARQIPAVERIWGWSRRKRSLAELSAFAAVLLIALATFGSFGDARATATPPENLVPLQSEQDAGEQPPQLARAQAEAQIDLVEKPPHPDRRMGAARFGGDWRVDAEHRRGFRKRFGGPRRGPKGRGDPI